MVKLKTEMNGKSVELEGNAEEVASVIRLITKPVAYNSGMPAVKRKYRHTKAYRARKRAENGLDKDLKALSAQEVIDDANTVRKTGWHNEGVSKRLKVVYARVNELKAGGINHKDAFKLASEEYREGKLVEK
jgi:hypothetical protein